MFDDVLGGKEAIDCSVVTDRNVEMDRNCKKMCRWVCVFNVCMCACVGFVMCGCFGNMCTGICCALYCLYRDADKSLA